MASPAFVASTAPILPLTPYSSSHSSTRLTRHCQPYRRAALCMTVVGPRPTTTSPAVETDSQQVDVLVVGSGVSGCSLAYQVAKDGGPDLKLLLTEARDVVGGNVISRNEKGYIWEEGPNTFQPAAHIMKLAVELGLEKDLVLADHRLPRFVYWNEKLFALPMSPKDLPTFRLLSPWGAIRAGLGALGFVLPTFKKEESIKDFITRHLGAEVFKKMIDPFVSGVYAGDPSKLCMSAAFKKIAALEKLGGTQGLVEGAIIRLGQRKREGPPPDPNLPKWMPGALGSFRRGLAMLPSAVAGRLGPDRVRLNWKLESLYQPTPSGPYHATYSTPSGVQKVIAKTVALTAPAHVAASILKDMIPKAERLNEIEYPCVYSVSLAYPKEAFKEPLSGFGNLIPRSMGIRTLGTIWSSSLFSGRCPEGMELLLSYIGGAQDPGIKNLTADEVVKQVDGDIKRILLKDDWNREPTALGVRKWPRAIPQYNVGYWDIMDEVDAGLEEHESLFLGGNYRTGVAFGDCIKWGLDTASEVLKVVETSQEKDRVQ
eukprot:Plantae.Rhodophyta-Hildenbrandia_rubra.ctg2684.p1 GENE.Plantae.Rhodophyta-Hildenbrandia_rubra.ctg2684~~Plantae.Rhodophyta-Hildenbrandia_rubra.ctg2684.p1  ORF type:complete len:542 (+),score=87.53 Plantae.Rhodophyta-Hildenbrandia_rubra.ctg2684:788-2413(+)